MNVLAWLDDERQFLLDMLQCDACGPYVRRHRASKRNPSVRAATTLKTQKGGRQPSLREALSTLPIVTQITFCHFDASLPTTPFARHSLQRAIESGFST
ncbi:hypothetical protein LN996_17105 [Arthrobacter sp. AK01]|uniref:hypothetical protein n=1 Tax=Arthrobacter sp. AK01 TaxID=2894084 RepID=UPI001E440D5D|nr:hypothetical protein [Arthrobacter sp. AK01]MCD4852537.1 hypothetical protein [Arthrobacter sp. AK01]